MAISKRLSKWSTYCFMLNGLIGGGILLIPSAFQQAGILTSLFFLLFVSLLCWLLHIELLAITEKLTLAYHDECKALIHEDVFLTSQYQWDLPEIVRLLCGPSHRFFYYLSFALYIIGVLTVYTNMSGKAFVSLSGCETAGSCEWEYFWGSLIYTAVIAALTVIDYNAQAWIQYIMVLLQIVSILLITILPFLIPSTTSDSHVQLLKFEPALAFETLSILIFASFYHNFVPSVVAASAKHHRAHSQLAVWMGFSIFVLYGLIGSVSGAQFSEIKPNISDFFAEKLPTQPNLPAIVRYGPVVDVVFNSPVYSQSLAGVLVTALYGPNHGKVQVAHPYQYRLIRLICVIPSFVVAAFFVDEFVLVKQKPAIAVSGILSALVALIYIPRCYNNAVAQLHNHSRFELKCEAVKHVNDALPYVTVAGIVIGALCYGAEHFVSAG